MNNNQLTILLTLKDRAAYTKRWLAYADKFHCPFPILIADGSKSTENADIVKNYLSKLDIQCYRYPFDENLEVYYHKVADAVSKIKTPFLVKVNNDDFHDFSILSQGIGLLEKNNSYHSCYIKALTFSIKKPFCIRSYSGANQIDASQHAHERLSSYFSGAPGAYDNIHRTHFYENFWQDVVRFKFRDIRSHEYLLNAASYASGNIVTTSSCGYFREESGQGNTCQIETNTLKEMMNAYWIHEQQQISEYIANILIQKDGWSRNTAIQFYFDGLRNLLSNIIVRDLLTDSSLTNNQRKHIYTLVLKDIISQSNFNKPIRKIFEVKNRVHKKEMAFSPIHLFLKEWYSKNANELVMKP